MLRIETEIFLPPNIGYETCRLPVDVLDFIGKLLPDPRPDIKPYTMQMYYSPLNLHKNENEELQKIFNYNIHQVVAASTESRINVNPYDFYYMVASNYRDIIHDMVSPYPVRLQFSDPSTINTGANKPIHLSIGKALKKPSNEVIRNDVIKHIKLLKESRYSKKYKQRLSKLFPSEIETIWNSDITATSSDEFPSSSNFP